jgi:Fe-S cluster assembly protein SufD
MSAVADLASPIAPYVADFQRTEGAPAAGEPAVLRAQRRRAIDRFAALGFPTTKQEEWRFTNLTPIVRGRFAQPAASRPELDVAALTGLTFESAARLVFVDGRFAPGLSETAGLPDGVVVTSLARALAERPADVTAHLGRYAGFEQQPFVALNTALWSDGAFVQLARGAVVEKPVHLLFLASGRPADGLDGDLPVAAYPRNLIVAGENSQLTIVESYHALADVPSFSCGVTEVVAGPSSVVDHCKVQRESREAFHVATFQLYQERSSAFSSHSISLGGALVRNDVNAVLDGEGADAILNGLYMIGGQQLVDFHMRVEHAKPHCTSHELFKGILDGRARSVFNGLIHVHKGAQKTDAKQSNRNLLLSKEAIANSNPQLEIYADDVKCTHGSTVGQLDDDAVFYLRSRGIGQEAARSLLTYAFASDIAARIKVESVRHDLEEYLFTALPKGEVVRQAV